VIEVEVHEQLRAFLRSQGEPYWPHHLTMARLVARALRLGRSSLIQTGIPTVGSYGRHRLSYLTPVLIWPGPAIVVAPVAVQQRLLLVEIPQLQQWIQNHKAIRTGDRWPGEDFDGVLIVSPQTWLDNALAGYPRIPKGIPTIIDGADDLERWARDYLRVSLNAEDWHQLMLARPDRAAAIRDARVRMTRAIFQHPPNPYQCCLLEGEERHLLEHLYTILGKSGATREAIASPRHRRSDPLPNGTEIAGGNDSLPHSWERFWQELNREDRLLWASVDREAGQFQLECTPIELGSLLGPLWSQQPLVLVGGALDLDREATVYREQLGLGDMTCVKFSRDRHTDSIRLYLPEGLPMPNTPEYQAAAIAEIRTILCVSAAGAGFTAILVEDIPFKSKLGSILAAEFGSRVQVEKIPSEPHGILVTGWEFWLEHQGRLPPPMLLAIATLPLPSLENPRVAGRVAYYKSRRLDWFRQYLLPSALNTLQRAIAPVRECQGVVALLDSRTLHRTYGRQVLATLGPLARIDYLDATWFNSERSIL